jgi:protein-S-isoprenylcysteine O-methyltransferase Ste14
MRLLLPYFGVLAVLAAALFGSAGRWDLPFFWGWLGLWAVFLPVAALLMDPGLRQERRRPGPGGKDRWFRRLLLPPAVALLVVAGLDAGRFGWSGSFSPWVQAAGLAACGAALALPFWAMMTNRFFSPVVRIQEERGHHVITGGPYRFVRHPGYAGLIAFNLACAVALGSWWVLLPAAVYAGMVVRRTALEDRFLHAELKGYADYAARVRYRLLPGVW